MKRTIILGASRGLGAELVRQSVADRIPTTGFARKELPLKNLSRESDLFEYRIADLTKPEGQDTVIRYLLEQDYDKVFCVAGGGAYQPFGQANWRDHDWAWEVTFRAHARVLHALAQDKRYPQVVLIGSSIAEQAGDKSAASYASAKHALKGLYSSVRLDYPDWDLRLFSPGYMDTSMLPAHAEVRKGGVYNPIDVAYELWTWSNDTDIGGHKVYPAHPY